MAHELEMIDGQAQMAYAGKLPWHGLGKEVDDNLSAVQMMEAAGLDWKVKEVPTFAEIDIGNGKEKVSTGMKALIRETDGKCLTQVGKNWHPVQNDEAFGFFHDFIESGDMKMHTAGSLKGGQIIWALAKVDDSFVLPGEDRVDSYLLFTNPHQYGKVIDIRFTPIRVVCNNTLVMANGSGSNNQVKLNHRKAFDADEVKEVLGMANENMQLYKEAAEFLVSKQATEKVMVEYFGDLLGRSKKENKDLGRNAERAMDLVGKQPGSDMSRGSFWQMFNAVTFMTDHVMGRSNDSRMTSAWYGQNAKLKQDALVKAVKMAETV